MEIGGKDCSKDVPTWVRNLKTTVEKTATQSMTEAWGMLQTMQSREKQDEGGALRGELAKKEQQGDPPLQPCP